MFIETPVLKVKQLQNCHFNTTHSYDHFVFCFTSISFIPDIVPAVRVFTNGTGDLGSIPKTQKMVLDASLLSTQHYKVLIKGKVEQSREGSSALPYTLV